MSEPLKDPLLDLETRARYLNPDTWRDDPGKVDIQAQVERYYQQQYPDPTDVVEQPRHEALARLLSRVDDRWSQQDPAGYEAAKGHIKQDLDAYANDSEHTPLREDHKRWAVELVQVTAKDSPYWDPRHVDHAAAVQKATALFEKIYNGGA